MHYIVYMSHKSTRSLSLSLLSFFSSISSQGSGDVKFPNRKQEKFNTIVILCVIISSDGVIVSPPTAAGLKTYATQHFCF